MKIKTLLVIALASFCLSASAGNEAYYCQDASWRVTTNKLAIARNAERMKWIEIEREQKVGNLKSKAGQSTSLERSKISALEKQSAEIHKTIGGLELKKFEAEEKINRLIKRK